MRGRVVIQILLALMAAGCGSSTPQEYTSTEGRYRVLFTGRPKVQDKAVPTALGPITAKIAMTEDWSRTARLVMYADYPAHLVQLGNRDAMLDRACQGMVIEARLTALSKVPIALNGHPGREVSFESQPGLPGPKLAGRARIFLVGNRLYQVFIAGPSGQVEPETIQGFLDSFALLDQGPGTRGAHVVVGPAPAGRPGPAANPPAQQRSGPNPRISSAPSPAASPAAVLALYNIPEPASAPIEADIPGLGSRPVNPPAGPERSALGGSPHQGSRAEGASIRAFRWVDENADVVGGHGDAARSDGTKDQHFRLELDLPANALIEAVVINSGPGNRWVTQPSDQYWPIAIFQHGRPIARSHVGQIGVYSGPQAFDLYFNTGIGIGPGSEFDLEIVLSIGGVRVTLTSQCRRPERGPAPPRGRSPGAAAERSTLASAHPRHARAGPVHTRARSSRSARAPTTAAARGATSAE